MGSISVSLVFDWLANKKQMIDWSCLVGPTSLYAFFRHEMNK